jgi:tricorn protease
MAAAALAAALLAAPATAQVTGYYNQPDIANGKIVFVSEGDLWLVDEAGGTATRLTSHGSSETMPRFSPDGTRIAYSAVYEGNRDVYVISVKGGEPTRLTWHGASDEPLGWTPDGSSVLFQTPRDTAHFDRNVWKVAATGGAPEKLPIGVASYLDMAEDGDTVVFNRNFTQMADWKRYKGGRAEDVWYGSLRRQDFRRITTYPGQDQTPVFCAGRIWFMSERDGRMNLWSMTPSAEDLRQHTTYSDFDVKWLQTDGKSKLVFAYGGDIVTYDTATSQATRVPIELNSDRQDRRPRIVDPAANITYASLSDDGNRVIATGRGDVFNLPVGEGGHGIALTNTSGAGEKLAQFAGKDDEWIVYVSDKTGEEHIYKRKARDGSGEEAITRDDDERRGNMFMALDVAYNSENLAFTDETGTLYWTNMTTKTLSIVDQGSTWRITSFDWSRDSRYLAYTKFEDGYYGRVYLYDREKDTRTQITDEHYDSSSAVFDPEMKYLYFLSFRDFNGWNDRVDYEVIMAPGTRVYGLSLREEFRNPFAKLDSYEAADRKKADEEKEKKEKEKGRDGKAPKKGDSASAARQDEGEEGGAGGPDGKKKDKDEFKEIELDGIRDRIFEVTRRPADVYSLAASKGRVFYTTAATRGRNEDNWGIDGPSGTVLRYVELSDKDAEEKTFSTGVSMYGLSRDREHIWYRTGGGPIKVAKAGGSASEKDDEVDFSGVTMRIEPPQEWAQMLEQWYRYYRDLFYVADLARIDLRPVVDRYKPQLARIGTRQELNEILKDLLGEMGHGHTYLWGPGDIPSKGVTPVATGSLGADFELDAEANRWRFRKIYRGERWDSGELRAPLDREGAEVKEGEYLLAVDGEAVLPGEDPHRYLVGKADKVVLLTVGETPDMEKARQVRVRPIAADFGLRYWDWIQSNKDYVSRKTNGEVGYVHIPDMGAAGLVNFFRDWYPQVKSKKAMVIDVRYNGGGNISQLLIQRLRREVLSWGYSRYFPKERGTYPWYAFTGPMACLINESAGSDGDIFPFMFRKSKLGPLIGERTWGGTVGISGGTAFIDGGSVTVPVAADFDAELGFTIENEGIEPDEFVPLLPQDIVAGRDPQLDRAIEYLKGEMDKPQYQWPDTPPTPDRSVDWYRKQSKPWMKKP